MRRFPFAILSLLPLFAQQQAPPPCLDRPAGERAYTRVRLMDVVRDQTPVRAEFLIRTCGVRVAFSADLETDLKEAGAEEKVIAAVRDVAARPPAPKPVVMEPKPEAPKPPAGPQAGDVRVNPKDGLRYAFVPAGTFRMGCADISDGPCDNDEKPAHDVQISKGFWMGQTEVTVEAYKRYARAAGKAMPSGLRWSADAHPMTEVDWNDARGYCEGAGLRLPSEAEWEYAARGGTTGARYAALGEIAWYSGNAGRQARMVAQKFANRFKLYDMLGNVWEWSADWYKDRYEGKALERDPQGAPGGEHRVLRGGSWNYIEPDVRASNRVRVQPSERDIVIGFRCTGELTFP